MATHPLKIVCLIALPEEQQTFLDVFPYKADRSLDNLLCLQHESGSDDVQLISILAEQMGSQSAQRSARVALESFDPDICVVIGIAGSVSKDVFIGDVVVSNHIIDVINNAKIK